MSQSTKKTPSSERTLADIVGVLRDGQTYKNVLYLLLAFPLGIAYFVFLTAGFAAGVALLVFGIGVGILFVTVVGSRLIASFERWLANALLDVEIAEPDDVGNSADGIVETAKAYLKASSTWKSLGFVFLKFWIGIVSFVLVVLSLGIAVELVTLPLFPDGAMNVTVNNTEIATYFETTAERALAVPAGVVLGITALHVLNAFASLNGSLASSLLGPGTQRTAPDSGHRRRGEPSRHRQRPGAPDTRGDRTETDSKSDDT